MPVNDTTNSAVKTGRVLASSLTPCKRRASESQTSLTGKIFKTATTTPSSMESTFTRVSVDSSVTHPSCFDPPSNQLSIARLQLGSKQLAEQFKTLQHQFVTNNNLATRVTTDSTECPEFLKLVNFVLDNANQLKNHMSLTNRHIVMKKYAFTKFRKQQYETLLAAVSMYVSETRAYWEKWLGKRMAFINVAHDVWDSKMKDVLGVSVFFYNPVRHEFYSLPLGLTPVEDKKSDPTALQTMDLLRVAGIEEEDLYMPVNDTTNSAVKTGRVLTGEDGSCAMHQVQLCFVHATGKVQRKKNNRFSH